MKKLLLFFTAVVAVVVLPMFAEEPSGFAKKVELTLSDAAKTALGEDSFANVPVLVKLSTAIQGFTYDDFMDERGADMVFSDGNGNVIPHEVDTWDPSGTSLVWLKPSSLSTSIGKVVMYFGSEDIPASSAAAVWSEYTGVWHLGEASGDALDSTGHGLDAVPGGANKADSVGVPNGPIGNARQFATAQANKTYLCVPDNSMLDCGETFAYSGWFKASAVYSNFSMRYVSRKTKYTDTNGWESEVRYAGVETACKTISSRGANSGDYTVEVPDIRTDWIHLTWVYNGKSLSYYLNGEFQKTLTLNSAASDNDLGLAFGSNPSGSESCWQGWMDELRLIDDVPTAEWLRIEHKAMTSDFFDFGVVETCDETSPRFGTPAVHYDSANGGFVFSVEMTAGSGDLYAVVTDMATGVVTTNLLENGQGASVPGTYSTVLSGLAFEHTFTAAAYARSTGGSDVNRGGATFYTGALAFEGVQDANEGTLGEGVLTVSRSALPAAIAGNLVVTYAVAGTAVPGTDYEPLSGTVTIPSGSASAEIRVKPIFNSDKSESVTVTITPAATSNFAVNGTESATIQIVNYVTDNTVRYVSTTGSDANDGLSLVMAKASIAGAVASLADVDGSCKVYVAPGTYTETNATTCIVLSKAIEVIGTTGNPKDVIVKRGGQTARIFDLSHEGATVCNLTMSGGKGGQGGNAYLTAGLVDNCILEDGYASDWNGGGGNVYLKDGRVSRCVIRGGYTNPTSTSSGRQVGGGIRAEAGLVENCLITANKNSYAPAARLSGTAKLLNCTITGNYNEKTSESECGGTVRIESKDACVVNCVIYGNTCANDVTGHDAIYAVSDDSFTANFINCAAEQQINVTCKAIDETVFAGYAKGDYTPIERCSLVDAGSDYATAGGVSEKDAVGLVRESGRGVDIGAYEFQYSESFMSFAGAPTFAYDAANDRIDFSVDLATGRGSIWAIFTDMGTQEPVTNLITDAATGGNAYVCHPSLAQDVVYSCAVLAVGLDGYAAFADGTNTIYTGEIEIEKVADAYETNCVAGAFVISRGSGISATAGDLVVTYEVGGTAVPGSVYKALPGTAVIPAGESSVRVEIAPMICPSVAGDVTVELTLAEGNYGIGGSSSASLTVYNCAAYNAGSGVYRFVSVTGDDSVNDGLTIDTAFATITRAVADLGEGGGRVYVAAGTYAESGSGSALTITTPVELMGVTGKAGDVVIKAAASNTRVLDLNHADATVRNVTFADGKITAAGGQGGNVFLAAGTIADCVLTGGQVTGNSGKEGGGNLFMSGGRVTRCVIKDGYAGSPSFRVERMSGGGFAIKGGVLENSLVIGNKAEIVAGGMVWGGGSVVNCTVTGNSGQCGGLASVYINKKVGTIENCVIYGNTSTRAHAPDSLKCYLDKSNDWGIDWTSTSGSFSNTFVRCLGEVAINANCSAGNPWFVDPANNDFRPGIVSSARDGGKAYAETAATSTTDFNGATRVTGAGVDIGCCELDPSAPLADIVFTQDGSLTPVPMSATANLIGVTGSATYWWDLDGDGVFERQSASPSVDWSVESGIGPGRISMRVDVGGTIISAVTRVYDYLPSDIYVDAAAANSVYPYCVPESAARYLQDALAIAGDGVTVHLAAGTYSSSAASAKFDVTNAVRIIGSTGNPDDVILQNTATINGNAGHKTITVNNRDAFVANLTIRNAKLRNISGVAGLVMGTDGGTVSNCVIRDNYHNPAYYQASAGVHMSAGLVTHCIVTNNSIDVKSTVENDAVGVMMSGGALENSFIGANRVTNNGAGKCFAIRATGGRIVNCDIIGNDLSSTNELAGALDVSGTAVVSNTVIFGNTKREIVDDGDETTSTNVVQALVTGVTAETALTACATDLTIDATAFTDYANGNYMPAADGALFNAGVEIVGAPKTDLAGHRRVYGTSIDIGCYEYSVPSGLKIILR